MNTRFKLLAAVACAVALGIGCSQEMEKNEAASSASLQVELPGTPTGAATKSAKKSGDITDVTVAGATTHPDAPHAELPKAIVVTGKRGMVVSISPAAADAGLAVLKSGGNAIDAAVEVGLMLGVVDTPNSGIGGGCFMLVHLADGRTLAFDGREMAPAAATHDMFIRDGKGDTHLSQSGPLASGIPGSLAVYDYAVKHFGKKTIADLVQPPAEVAENGFVVNDGYARRLAGVAEIVAKNDGLLGPLLHADGTPIAAGETLKQPDLAKTYRGIGSQGIGYFYGGPFAQAVGAWMSTHGGIITAQDFANYQMKEREPILMPYHEYTIVGFPPPSSGGLHVAQILKMVERFDLADMQKNAPVQRVNVIAQAMRLAFADRAFFLGDPDFVHVPKGLIDADYLAQRSKLIDPMTYPNAAQHGDPPEAENIWFGKHTTHIATADSDGNWVSMTQTVNTSFGSKVIVPGTGVVLNDQMDDFSIQPGVPNAFHLVGNESNAPAPGKRPLSSMSPTLVLKDGKPFLSVGAAGGPRIITQVALVTSNVLDLHDDLGTAMSRPRFHHQWSPESLWAESSFDDDVLAGLRKIGYSLDVTKPAGATQAIELMPDGTFVGVGEPRAGAKAAGW